MTDNLHSYYDNFTNIIYVASLTCSPNIQATRMAHLKPSRHKETISRSSLSLSATLIAANNGVHATYMRNRENDREEVREGDRNE